MLQRHHLPADGGFAVCGGRLLRQLQGEGPKPTRGAAAALWWTCTGTTFGTLQFTCSPCTSVMENAGSPKFVLATLHEVQVLEWP